MVWYDGGKVLVERMNFSVIIDRHNSHPSSCNVRYVCLYIASWNNSDKRKRKSLGLINKEVDSIGHRSIVNDELAKNFFEPMKDVFRLDWILFSFSSSIEEYVNTRNRIRMISQLIGGRSIFSSSIDQTDFSID